LFLIIPFIILYIFIFNYVKKIDIEKSVGLIISEQKQEANTIDYIIKNMFYENIEDLSVIKKSNELSNFINNPTQLNKTEVAQMFYRVALIKKNFEKIRL